MKKIHFEEIDSTNLYLKNNYKNLDNFTFVSADYQNKGRGRYDRIWSSKKGDNLLFSFLIKDKSLIEKYSSISLLIAAVILKEIRLLGINNVSIKWPNDVYIDNNKVSGILLEGISTSENIDALIVGVGINVNQKEFEKELKATSLAINLKTPINLSSFKESLFKSLIFELNLLKENKSDYLEIVKNNNYLKNKICNATYQNKIIEIEVIDVNVDNTLKVKYKGSYLNINSGEITFSNKEKGRS